MDKKLEIEQKEQQWLKEVYLGDKMSEFTFKVVLVGSLIGILLISSNIYLGLKIGMTQGGSILAALLTFAFIKSFKGKLSLLENNIAQTMASAAAGLGILVSAIPALILLGYQFSGIELFIWILLVHVLAVLFAIPLRKQFIIIEQLTFPSGTACAETLKAIHSHGDDAVKKSKILGITGLLSGLITWFRDGIPAIIPEITMFPAKISTYAMGQLTLGINWSPMSFGIGFLVGPRIGLSLLLGALISWAILGPLLANLNIIEGVSYPQIRNWTMWPAIALMVSSAIISLFLKGKSIIAAFRSLKGTGMSSISQLEISFRIWIIGILGISATLAIIMLYVFNIPVWMTVLAIILAYLFSVIATRTYGETDMNPVGAMGYGTQIIFGGLAPGNTLPIVITAGVTAAGANESADLMQDFKTGYLLGATPKKQTYAQLLGVLVGSMVAIPVFLAITGAYGIATETMPAPSAQGWSGMAKLLSQGFSALPAYTSFGVAGGLGLGILLTLLEKPKWQKYTPSPFGIGIAMFLPGFVSISIFLGSVMRFLLEKKYPQFLKTALIPLASGGIVGEAVIGVLISILIILGIL